MPIPSAILRQAAAVQSAGRGAATVTYPAPVGGRNSRDPQDALPPTDAIRLDNWFADVGKVSLRKGESVHATNAGTGDVESVMSFNDGATNVLLCAESSSIYAVTAAGSAGSAIATGKTNARWQDFMSNGKLALLNGADAPLQYDGASITSMPASGTGLTNTELIAGLAYKSRTIFWEKAAGTNPTSFWYSALNALGGALTQFDIATKSSFAGNIVSAGLYSRDAGDGLDDFLVFLASDGTMTVWNGTDPGDATAWSHVGTYKTGQPLSVRAVGKIGGELVFGTTEGYVTVSAVLQGGQQAIALSDKINSEVEADADNFKANFGWAMANVSGDNQVWFNVPVLESTTYRQDVWHSRTGAWSRFTDIPVISLKVHNGVFYGGATGGRVLQLANGRTNLDGGTIRTVARTGPQRIAGPNNVRTTAVKPVIQTTSNVSAGIDVEVDFVESGIQDNVYTFTGSGDAGTLWEDLTTEFWENWTENWDEALQSAGGWYSAPGYGGSIGVRFTTNVAAQLDWYSTQIAYEQGGPV